jgi:hypothetical protein
MRRQAAGERLQRRTGAVLSAAALTLFPADQKRDWRVHVEITRALSASIPRVNPGPPAISPVGAGPGFLTFRAPTAPAPQGANYP